MDILSCVIARRLSAAACYMARLEGRAYSVWSAADRRLELL